DSRRPGLPPRHRTRLRLPRPGHPARGPRDAGTAERNAMNPTLHDLREALSDAESKAPDSRTVLARVRRGVVRRQRRRAIAAVAAIALFATVGMTAADQLPGGNSTGSRHGPRFQTWFRESAAWPISLGYVTTTVQVASIGDDSIL